MKAFTLVELIMVIVIIGILAGIGIPMILETVDAWSFSSRFQDNAVLQAIVAMNRMSKEIRRLLNDNSITSATDSQLTFVDLSAVSIIYSRSGNTLMRNSDALADVKNDATGLKFTYYDDNGNILSAPVGASDRWKIRRINVNLKILAGSNTLDFQFQVRPQNLRRLNEKFK